MATFRTSSIFRFCNDRNMLQKYLETGIYPNYCEENLTCDELGVDLVIGIPMASFCDIPMTLLSEHYSRYGEYGIGLSKDWALANGISPIMYITNDNTLRSILFHRLSEQEHVHEVNSEKFKKDSLTKTIVGSPDKLESYIKILNSKTEVYLNRYLLGFYKKYMGEYEGKDICNYAENEWRYIVPESDEIPWFWNHDDYTKWRSPKGLSKCPKPEPTPNLVKNKLTFDAKDITYIIVKEEVQVKYIVKKIRKLKTIGGSTRELSEEDKDILCSRIISRSRIENDF